MQSKKTHLCSLFFLICLFKATILNIRNNIETTNIYAYFIPVNFK